MGATDFTELTDGADLSAVDRGVTAGVTPPWVGGGSFLFGFNSLGAAQGTVGFRHNAASFAPMAKGARVEGAMFRSPAGALTGFSHFIFAGLQDTLVGADGYLLGLEDANPARIVLVKGSVSAGIPQATVTNSLRRSAAFFNPGQYVHLRLDMVVNGTGDVVLNVRRNQQALDVVPVWNTEPGLERFIDDTLGINSGTSPFLSGHAGYGFSSAVVSARGFLDQLAIARQL
jgi:hypothetical protein